MNDKTVSTNKYWVYILLLVTVLITLLLGTIIWKLTYNNTGSTSVQSESIEWRDNTPHNLILSYYQAIANNNSNLVQRAWGNPNIRPARYAQQAMLSSKNNICTPTERPKSLDTSENKAIVNVILKCKNNNKEHQYSLNFYLIKNKKNLWRIYNITDKQEKTLN